ncbi:hypothetical protein [Sphingomonas sp. RB1R13]|uniref:hypothetical protein n=1 Tax=Sphingomonas sp. RB1R13 TaxID=3096159 RepID=UPI002FC8C2D2
MNEMQKLRAAIVRQMSATERRQIRWLSFGMEEQRQKVLDSLPTGSTPYSRMLDCGMLDEWQNVRYCAVPLCPRCFLRRRSRETAQSIQKTFAEIPNKGLAFLTLLLPVTTDIDDVSSIIRAAKTRLNNIVARYRRHDPRWNDVQLTGWWEMDCSTDTDREEFGRNRKLAFDELNWPLFGTGRTVWQPHFHAIVATGAVSLDEIKQALRGKAFDAPYQVDLKPFDPNRHVTRNIKDVVRYSLKFRVERQYKEVRSEGRKWWSKEDISTYGVWLSRRRGGFQALRFSIGPLGPLTQSAVASPMIGKDAGIKNRNMMPTGCPSTDSVDRSFGNELETTDPHGACADDSPVIGCTVGLSGALGPELAVITGGAHGNFDSRKPRQHGAGLQRAGFTDLR